MDTRTQPGRRPRVLVVPAWYPEPHSPVTAVFVQDQVEVLARAYDVQVLLPRWVAWHHSWCGRIGPAFATEPTPAAPIHRRRHVQWLPRLLGNRLLWPGHGPIEAHCFRYRAALERGFGQFVERFGRPDLLHAHVALPAGWVAARLGRRHGIPVVLTEHSGPFEALLQSRMQRRIVGEALDGASRVLAVSPALADAIRRFRPALRVDVLGNVVRAEFFTPAAEPALPGGRPFTLLVAALLHEAKGVQVVLEAAARLHCRGLPPMAIRIAGDGPYRRTLEALVRRLGLTAECAFLGMLSREALRDEMRRCDALGLASRGETFGLVLAEAMACGKPVIATRCGGPEFVVTPQAGLLTAVDDADSFANALAQLVCGDRRFDVAAIRMSVVDRFGEDAFLRNVAAVYASVWSEASRVAA